MTKLLRIWHLLTLPCEEIARLTSMAFEQELPWAERLAVKIHMVYCKACRRYRRQVAALRETICRHIEQIQTSESASALSLSPEARDRIKRSLTPGE